MEKQPVPPSEFYDLRGVDALRRISRKCGSSDFRECFREPYRFMERQLDIAYAMGARSLLDVCCGTGTHSVAAANQGFRVHGVDISAKSIESAVSLASQFGLTDRCSFEVRSFDEFVGNCRESFDVVLISGSLYYLDNVQVLRLCGAVLAKGGLFICVETFGDNPFMSMVRNLKNRIYGHRDVTTLNSLLGTKEIRRLTSGFRSADVAYFDLFTLATAAFPEGSVAGRLLIRMASLVDWVILNKLGMRLLSFKFVIVGRK